MTLYRCVMQIISKSTEGWSTSNGAPTLYLDACDASAAVQLARGIVHAVHAPGNHIRTSGCVARAQPDSTGTLVCDGADTLSWTDATLACGHEPSTHGPHTTGTATLPDGREVCWTCSDDWMRERMTTAQHVTLYTSSDGRTLKTWNGTELAQITSSTSRRVGPQRTTRVYFRAVDTAGREWHGNSPGPEMIAHLHALHRGQ